MAEYITKEQIIGILYAPRKAVLTFEDFVKSIGNLTPADVIERSKADKAIEEIDNLDLNRVAMEYEDRFYGFQLEVIEILKRNIGE